MSDKFFSMNLVVSTTNHFYEVLYADGEILKIALFMYWQQQPKKKKPLVLAALVLLKPNLLDRKHTSSQLLERLRITSIKSMDILNLFHCNRKHQWTLV